MSIAQPSRFLLALALSTLASTALGAAPQAQPTIRGIVVDSRGAPLPGAVVSLDLPGITTVSGVDGRFAITPGTAGNRRIRVSLAGFDVAEVTVVVPEAAGARALDEVRITLLPVSTPAAPARDYRWSIDGAIGFDNSISGNINSGAIGTLSGQAVVFTKNTYGDVYGTGFHFRFGGGYRPNEDTEVRASFTYQSLGADLTRMGDVGISNLYGQYDDYKTLGLDFGYRRYSSRRWGGATPYAEGALGIAFISEIDVLLAAPQANVVQNATDFYDRTAAFTFGVNGGVLVPIADRVDLDFQVGLRYVTGLSQVDDLVGTGLEAINDDSARWTIPFVIGVRTRF
jgi:Carboxypeptidase regulatory-like domain